MLNLIKNWLSRRGGAVDNLVSGTIGPEAVLNKKTIPVTVIGAFLLVAGLGGFLVWSVTAPIDEGVPAEATVAVEAKRKTVQHLTGGVIAELPAREAMMVNEGDLLIRLDKATLQSSRDAAEQSFSMAKAAEVRLMAEQKGAAAVEFPESLSAKHLSKSARANVETQRSLFYSRRAALQSDLQVLAEAAANFDAQSRAYEVQLALLTQELSGVREMAKEGYVARNRLSEMERTFSDLMSNQQRALQTAVETRARASQRRSDYLKEVESQLAEFRRDAAIAEEKLRVADDDLSRSDIRAPISGYVVGLTVHTVGGVVSPGRPLMDIVPLNKGLILEAKIHSHLIDRVKPGLLAKINIQTFANAPDLVVEGKVVTVSADLLFEENPNLPPYYLAQVEVTPEGVKELAQYKLQPGMPASVVILTGERTFMAYLLKPLLRRLHVSLTES